jgi:hypothetical protein
MEEAEAPDLVPGIIVPAAVKGNGGHAEHPDLGVHVLRSRDLEVLGFTSKLARARPNRRTRPRCSAHGSQRRSSYPLIRLKQSARPASWAAVRLSSSARIGLGGGVRARQIGEGLQVRVRQRACTPEQFRKQR